MPGMVTGALGGSLEVGEAATDCDLGVNCRGAIDLTALGERSTVHLCECGQWVLYEKRLIETAGFAAREALFAQVPIESASLVE